MSLRFKAELQNLADRGIGIEKITPDEIEALVFACRRVDNPYDELNADLVDQPVKVCKGIYLWPMTAGALIWLTEYAEQWWPKGSAMHRWAMIYALRNARSRDAFSSLTERKAARWAIVRCMLSMCCHRRELAVAVNRCFSVRELDAEDDTPSSRNPDAADDFARFAASLEVHSGIKAEHWLWGRSLRTARRSYARMRNIANALGGGKELELELDDSLRNLARVKAGIVRRVEVSNGGK